MNNTLTTCPTYQVRSHPLSQDSGISKNPPRISQNRNRLYMDNSILVIFPYKYEETWVFDDPAVNLVKEPFVCGVPEMIDRLALDIPNADEGFKLIFSDRPFPGFQEQLTWVRKEYSGSWYKIARLDLEGWLCPALFKYFSEAPPDIYVKAEAKRG